ncbi:glycosyltransferase family 4 protein [Planctomicrobium sp.]|nr:glycosyltransferase family 4 protein [Planctomicrobium sp.]
MHDNTWARSLMQAGHEVSLIPTYTPIRVDDHNESQEKVFFGGINVFLNEKVPGWRFLPRAMTRWLDRPSLIQWATSRSVSNNAEDLGPLTISMVKGESGPHHAAIRELDEYISDHLKPDVVIFSNALLVGAVRELKKRFSGPVLCVLQGDDVFLDGLKPNYRETVIDLISERAQEFDGFLVHSHFYKEYISNYLNLPVEKFSVIPLGIDFTGHDGKPKLDEDKAFTVGYFARIAPEKGLHHLVNGFVELRKQLPNATLRIGGYLGPQFQNYLDETLASAQQHQSAIEYIGSPATQCEKVEFLKSLDVLSVPTEFLEPKGLYVLEAMANGIPVVQPSHGSFPEIISSTGGGLLVEPKNPAALASGLLALSDYQQRHELAQIGWEKVREFYSPEAMSAETIRVINSFLQ